jgi:hypothetical protein
MAAQQLISVPFHGQTLYVIPFNDEPYTPMRPIVEGMGLDWKSQHRKLTVNPERWGVVIMTIPSAGGPQEAVCMPVRKLPGWNMTIQHKRANPAIRERILTYQNESDDVLWQYWRKANVSVSMPFTSEKETLPPMAKVDPALLREYRLINPGLAQAYLVEMGVTPAHVVNLLARVPAWVNQSGATPPAPIGHVRAAVALYATQEDKTAWYVLPDAFGRLCGEFSARETARMLRDLGFLRSDLGRLTAKAPRRLFPARPNLFVVLKSLNNETGGSHG